MLKWRPERNIWVSEGHAFKLLFHFSAALICLQCCFYFFVLFAHALTMIIYFWLFPLESLYYFVAPLLFVSLRLISLLSLLGSFHFCLLSFSVKFTSFINYYLLFSLSFSKNCPSVECDLLIQFVKKWISYQMS